MEVGLSDNYIGYSSCFYRRLLAYNISKNIIKGNIYKSVANSSDISEKTVQKSRLYKKKMPFVRIAKINMSSYKKKNILSVLVIVLAFTAITLFRVFSVYLFGYEENVGYEYKITMNIQMLNP